MAKTPSTPDAANLLALSHVALVALLKKTKRPPGAAYRSGPIAHEMNARSLEWMRKKATAPDALRFLDAMLEAKVNMREVYCNALWAIQDDNTHLGVNPKRARRYLKACLPHGPENPAIFFNAMAVLVELGDIEGALEQTKNAARHGYGKLDLMEREFRTAPIFKSIRHDRRFFEALRPELPEGDELMSGVIERVKSKGWAAIDEAYARVVKKQKSPFRPLAPALLEALTLPNGAPLPSSLRQWLSFDAGYLQHLGWYRLKKNDLEWTSRTMGEIALAEYGGDLKKTDEDAGDEDDEREINWAIQFDTSVISQAFLLPGGSDSRRVWVLTETPDSTGDYPVIYTDIDDMPALGVMYPGLDVYFAADRARTLTIAKPDAGYSTYTDAAEDKRFAKRMKHHAKVLLGGQLEVQFPRDTLKPKVATARKKPAAKPARRRSAQSK